MATNPLIALSVQQPDIVGNFNKGRQNALAELQAGQTAQRQNRLLELQEQQARTGQETAGLQQQAARLQITGDQRKLMGQAAAETALSLDPLIKAGDFQGALSLLDTSYARMAEQGLKAPDPTGLREALRSGNAEAATQMTSGIVNRARQLGFIGRDPTASALNTTLAQEAKTLGFDLATPEGRADYAQFKQSTRPPTYSPYERAAANVGAYEQKQGIKAATEPGIAGETARAQQEAKAEVERAGQARSNASALQAYETAMGNLFTSLGDTTTGPIAGRIPALTVNQQIAEGAQAALAPLLKQVFRTAGEGTFTDKDQDLLMAMVPTRKDHPEAAKAKIHNIDAIVRAKLAGASAAPAPTATPQRLRFNPQTGELE